MKRLCMLLWTLLIACGAQQPSATAKLSEAVETTPELGVIWFAEQFPRAATWPLTGPWFYTRYGYNAFTNGTGSFSFLGGTGDPTTEQANADALIQQFSGNSVKFFSYLHYGRAADLVAIEPVLAKHGVGANGMKFTPPTVTLTGSYSAATHRDFMVKIVPPGGARGTAQFQVSYDRGSSWGSSLTTAASVSLGSGVSLTFASGTYSQYAYYDVFPHDELRYAFERYEASSYRTDVKFAWMLLKSFAQYPGGWENWTTFSDYWVGRMQANADSYLLYGDRPVVLLFANTTAAGDQWPVSYVVDLTSKITTAGFATPHYVGLGMSLTQLNAIKTAIGGASVGRANYGGPKTKPGSTGHFAWSAQVAEDVAAWPQSPSSPEGLPTATLCQDPRARADVGLPGYGYYVDRPTFSESEIHWQKLWNRISNNPTKHPTGLGLAYAIEQAEGGDLMPSLQEGDKYLRAWLGVRTQDWLSEYWDRYPSDSLHVTAGGTWTRVRDLTGAYNYADLESTTDGSYLELSCEAGLEIVSGRVGTVTDGVRLNGETGPGLGEGEVFVDTQSQGTISFAAPSTTRNAVLFQQTLSAGTHTVRFERRSGTVKIDEIGCHRTRSP